MHGFVVSGYTEVRHFRVSTPPLPMVPCVVVFSSEVMYVEWAMWVGCEGVGLFAHTIARKGVDSYILVLRIIWILPISTSPCCC